VFVLVLPKLDGASPDVGVKGNEEFLLETLDGVVGGADVSTSVPLSAKSTLFPTSMSVRFGDARARASFTNEGNEAKVGWDVISYTRTAPAAPL
jgi:hypothetical protein